MLRRYATRCSLPVASCIDWRTPMTRSNHFANCLGRFFFPSLTCCLLLGLAQAASAQTCLQNEYNLVQKQKLNCTANDVRIAQVTNIRDPITGKTISTCFQGSTFNFLADFEILTTSSQA